MAQMTTELRGSVDMDSFSTSTDGKSERPAAPRLDAMPHLSRTARHADVSRLDAEPQKDLRAVHAVLLRGIADVDNKLRQLEQSHYGPGRTAVDELTRWAAAIRPMLPVAGVLAFLSAEQVNNATRRQDVDADGLDQLQQQVVTTKKTKKKKKMKVEKAAVESRPTEHAMENGKAESVEDLAKSLDELEQQIMDENAPQDTSFLEDKEPKEADGITHDYARENNEPKTTSNQEISIENAVNHSTPSRGRKAADEAAEDNEEEEEEDEEESRNDVIFKLSRTLRDCLRKTLDAVPEKFEDIMSDVRRLQRHMRKYCVSFYDPPPDSSAGGATAIDTAATYEAQIRRRLAIIDESLDSIRDLADQFRRSELNINDFGPFGSDLARRTGSAHAPFLLLFPAACERIRIVLATMRDWIGEDADYADFIANDVADLERRLKTLDRRLVASRRAFHQVLFRTRQSAAACEQLATDLSKTQGREDQLTVDEEILANETAELRSEAETTEYRLAEISRNASRYTAEAHYEKLNELTERLREIKARLPVADQALTNIRQKLAQLNEKRDQFKSESKRLSNLEKQRDDIATKLSEQEVDHDACAQALETARRILLCKRSSDAVRKIFYDRPAHLTNTQRLPGVRHQDSQGDEFDQTCRIVSARIERDWQLLYRTLPFLPPRGTTTIDRDIDEMDNSRDPLSVAAERALARWRRYHTRACVDELKAALRQIGRSDVLKRVAAVVSPPAPQTVTLSEVPDWVEPELVPFWREVERFDELRASHHKH